MLLAGAERRTFGTTPDMSASEPSDAPAARESGENTTGVTPALIEQRLRDAIGALEVDVEDMSGNCE